MKKGNLILLMIFISMLISCTTTSVDMERNTETIETGNDDDGKGNELLEDEFLAEVNMKENDIAQAVLLLESPDVLIVPDDTTNGGERKKGIPAVKENMSDMLVYPEYENGRMRGWLYGEGKVYRIITQTYHSTLIRLEPGENMLEEPYCSEIDAWRISRGIAYKDGVPQHVVAIKPDYSGLNSTLIIVTDRRIYQMEIVSTKETYMPTVQWIYPRRAELMESASSYKDGKQLGTEITGVSQSLLSFDYVMKHPAKKKPVWCPTMVYDDGVRTYIVLAEDALLQEFPVIFNEKNEIVNYRTKDNMVVIDRLIEKVTLRNKADKVTIEKKIRQTR